MLNAPYRRLDSDEERTMNRELFSSIQKGDLSLVKTLLENGVNTDIIDMNNKDNSPLHYAIERNKKEVVEELLHPRWKTEINLPNKVGNTPLHIATYDGNKELVQLLLDNQAESGAKNGENKTPLEIAQHHNWADIVDILESYSSGTCPKQGGTSKDQNEENELESSETRRKTIQHDPHLFLGDNRKKLLIAINEGNFIEAENLIQGGVDVDFEDEDGNTPLDVSIICNEEEIIKVLGKKIIYNSLEVITGKSQISYPSHTPNKEEKIEEKIKKKVEFSLDALKELTKEQGDIRKFTHKNVNIFVLFLEAFALQDVEINNKLSTDEKNKLIDQYFGEKDNEIIKNIRENFVKRNGKDCQEKKIISPLYLQNFVPETNRKLGVKNFFCNLQNYVQGVYDKLSGQQSGLNQKDIGEILTSNSMQKIKSNETVFGLFCDLVQEAYSKNPNPDKQEKVMFDLTVNIIPLIDEELKEEFEELRNLRHDLIHNFYKYRDPFYRLKECKRAIFDLRSKIFKYYIAQEIHRKFCEAPLDQKLDRTIDSFSKELERLEEKCQDFLVLPERETTGSFEHVFSELIFSERADDVEYLVGKYLTFFAVIDDQKRGQIDNEEESEISEHYRELSDVERREIFEDFVRLEEIKEFHDQYEIKKEDLKQKFVKYGIEECYFDKTIEFSLESNNVFDKELIAITDIVKGIKSLKNSKELAGYTISNQDIVSLYDRFIQEEFNGMVFCLNNHKDLLRNYDLSINAKQFIEKKLSNLINKDEIIDISSKGIQINISKVVNNILKTFYNAYHKYQIKFDNVEAAFSDKIFLDFLVSRDIKKNNLGPWLHRFDFKDKNYIFRIIKKLLKEEYTAPYIANLITKTQNDEVIEEDDLRKLIEILCKKNTYVVYLNELLDVNSKKPSFDLYEIVYEIFEKGDISTESMHVILGDPKHSREMLNVLDKRIDSLEGNISDRNIECTKNVLKILNDIILELIYKKKSDSALDILTRQDKNNRSDNPVQLLYQKLVCKGLIEINDNLFVNYQLNIAKAKNAKGVEKTRQNNPEEAEKLHEDALNILKRIIESLKGNTESPKFLLTLSRLAYTQSLLARYDEASKEYYGLYKKVIKIAGMEDTHNTKEFLTQIEKSNEYQDLLSSSNECKKYLNIVSIKKSIAFNEYRHGFRSQDQTIKYLEKALKMYKEVLNLEKEDPREEYKTILPTRKKIAFVYENIAKLKLQLKEYSKALWYYYCALQEESTVYRKEKYIYGDKDAGQSKGFIIDMLCSIARTHNKLGEESSNTQERLTYFKIALNIYEEVSRIQKAIFGEEHKGTLKTKINIAFTCNKLGEESSNVQQRLTYFKIALNIYEEVSRIQKAIFGEEHKGTLKTKINIAFTCNKLGEESSNMQQQLTYFKTALDIYEEVYRIQKDIFGEEHEGTLKTKSNIAFTHNKLGEESSNTQERLTYFKTALNIYEEVYKIQKQIFGEEHKNTLQTKNIIAFTYYKLGEESSNTQQRLTYFKNAQENSEQVYSIQEGLFGKENEETVKTLNNILKVKTSIAFSYNKLGEESSNSQKRLTYLKKALNVYEEVYGIQKDVLGKEHKGTLKTRTNIALTYYKLGEESSNTQQRLTYFKNAQENSEQVYSIQEGLFGKDNEDSVKTLNYILKVKTSIAFSYNKLGEESSNMQQQLTYFKTALDIYEEVYRIQKAIFGEEHKGTLKTKTNIAFTHNKLGEESSNTQERLTYFKTALNIYEEVYKIQKQIFGEEHKNTLQIKNTIAFTYYKLGEESSNTQQRLTYFKNAQENSEQVYSIQEGLFGKENEETVKTLNYILKIKTSIAFSYKKLGEESLNRNPQEYFNMALSIYKNIYEIQNDLFGEEHEKTLKTVERIAYTCHNLSSLHKKNGNLNEARKYSGLNLRYLLTLKEKKWKDAEVLHKKATSFHDSITGHQTPSSTFLKKY